VPHARILPTGIDRLEIICASAGPRSVRARERLRQGNEFTYDVEVYDSQSNIIERWEGLHLRAVEPLKPLEAWPEALIGPFLERRIEELGGGKTVHAALASGPRQPGKSPERRKGRSSDRLMQTVLNSSDRIWRRTDGKPMPEGGKSVSAAYADEFSLAVGGEGRIGCDLEFVVPRSDVVWRDLLGADRFKLVSKISAGKSLDESATRLWNAVECLKKAGLPADAPLVLDSTADDGWAVFRAGSLKIATWIASIRGAKSALSVAVAFDAASASSPHSSDHAFA
jgi:enediyne polyketide synthase